MKRKYESPEWELTKVLFENCMAWADTSGETPIHDGGGSDDTDDPT